MASVRFSTVSQVTLFDMEAPDCVPLPPSNRNTLTLPSMTEHDLTESSVDFSGVSHASPAEDQRSCTSCVGRSRSSSSATLSSIESARVDWDELDRSEEQAPRDLQTDESTAFLLARLEEENNALATNPKAKLARARSLRKPRPASVQFLQKLVNEPAKSSLRYSIAPEPPAMTELEFWAALVNDYPQTAQRLPTLTSKKIRGGVPPPLRGVVWTSIAGSRDRVLEDEYTRLCGETSPYENLIGKDIGRSFPAVEMFRDPLGEGQQMLARVLKCFSLYDDEIGYCQGLGFVVGPLLMHMGDMEAFGVLVRLMEHYDLRSCFLPSLSGLHLRIYQFQQLLNQHHPNLASHLESIGVESLYVSQWFLSFFAITCPLPMLLRIYDVILTEGASETLMRVALSLMRRNQENLFACAELEDAMTLLLGSQLWDVYDSDADGLVNDFVSLTGLVTRENLEALERSFTASTERSNAANNVQNAAARFIGRFLTCASPITARRKPSLAALSTSSACPSSILQHSPSKQSLESSDSSENRFSASTDATTMSKHSDDKSAADLQIEELLNALSEQQRENNLLARELQREREEREDEKDAARKLIADVDKEVSVRLEAVFSGTERRSSLVHQTKQQMREEIALWKQQYEVETGHAADLTKQLVESQSKMEKCKAEVTHLEQVVADLRRYSDESEFESTPPATSADLVPHHFAQRSSSLGISNVLATTDHKPPAQEAVLVELVNVKTSEAVARQELEEVRAKLDSFRRMLGGDSGTASKTAGHVRSVSAVNMSGPSMTLATSPTATTPSGMGSFFGWGRRTPSVNLTVTPAS